MRLVCGDARLVEISGGPHRYGLEAAGLHAPAPLVSSAAGDALPDLSAAVGSICCFSGVLATIENNLNTPLLLVTDLYLPHTPLEHPTPLFVTVSGRLGNAPEPNKEKAPDWYNGSICYHSPADRNVKSSWLRLTARSYHSIADAFLDLEAGAAITAFGPLESWETEAKKPRCCVSLRGFDRNAARSYAAATAPSASLVSSAAPTSSSPADDDNFTGSGFVDD